MKKTKFLEPYTNGKTTFPKRNTPGVYLIKKDGVVRYVGMSRTDVYKTLYRHFQSWDDPRQIRVVYKYLKGISVRVVYTTPDQATKLESALIIKLKPTDNPAKIQREIEFLENKAVGQMEEAEIVVPF